MIRRTPVRLGSLVGYTGVAVDGVGPEQEDLWDDRDLAQSGNRRRASVCLPGRHRAQAQLGWRGSQRLAAGGDRCEQRRLSGDSRHLRRRQGGQGGLERVPHLLHAATHHPVEVAFDPLIINRDDIAQWTGVVSVMAAPSCCPGCVLPPPVQPDLGPPP